VELGRGAGLLYTWPAVLGILLVLTALAPTPAARRLLEHRGLVFLGVISYGLYVIHPLFLYAVESWSLSVRTEVGVAASILVAAASRRWFESWFLRRKPRETATSALVDGAQDARPQPATTP
jgi:peptidoglycan/LPS O-acetylase OafA/YrhL